MSSDTAWEAGLPPVGSAASIPVDTSRGLAPRFGKGGESERPQLIEALLERMTHPLAARFRKEAWDMAQISHDPATIPAKAKQLFSLREVGWICAETYKRNSSHPSDTGGGGRNDIMSGLNLHGEQFQLFQSGWDAFMYDWCSKRAMEHLLKPNSMIKTLAYTIWQGELALTWSVMYFLDDSSPAFEEGWHFPDEKAVLGAIEQIRPQGSQLRRLSRAQFYQELALRRKNEETGNDDLTHA